jgi:hypothetical protein
MSSFTLQKLKNTWDESSHSVTYQTNHETSIDLSSKLGQALQITHTGKISCIHCGRDLKKTFQNGYCYPCTQKLAETDMCQVKPEECHYFQGTCRDADFAARNCFIPHTVYLAQTGDQVKVGITRSYKRLHRWMDQGATQAIIFAEVPSRKIAGEFEMEMKNHLADKTNWRKMLQGTHEPLGLLQKKEEIISKLPSSWQNYVSDQNQVYTFEYPVNEYPDKIKSLDISKTPEISSELQGIKGQYLILTDGVMNVRKFQGYEIEMKFL